MTDANDGMSSVAMIERVRKLLAKAEGTEHAHEAEAFAAKAAQLIAAHRLSVATLDEHTDDRVLGLVDLPLGRGAYVRARLQLLIAIAAAHDADVVFQTGEHGMTAHVAGFRTDLDAVRVLYDSLHRQAAAQMAGQRGRTAASTQRWRRAFLFGFAERVGELLRTVRTDVETSAGGAGATALALRARRERVREHTARSFPRVTTAARPAPSGGHGWHRGRAAADRADLGRPRVGARRALGRGS